MKTYLLKLSYLGGNYHGWQTQPSKMAIQDTLESALSTILGHKTKVKGASRTDSGVHAEEQFATFVTGQELDKRKLFGSLCGILPDDIRVRDVSLVDNTFDVINDNRGKAYVYRIWNHKAPHPFIKQVSWHLKTQTLDPEKLKEALELFSGQRNFKAYAAVDGNAKTFVRNILEVDLRVRSHLFEFWFIGEGFLKQMIRNIVGTCTDYSKGKMSIQNIEDSFQEGDRTRTGLCAPAEGLTLHRIFFDKPQQIRDLQNEMSKKAAISL